jgi:hypothetical protein
MPDKSVLKTNFFTKDKGVHGGGGGGGGDDDDGM